MLPTIISIVGVEGSGKTTLVERLVPILVQRGYQVGTIKHHVHGDASFDTEGKDTWRHRVAGARVVVISSPVGGACFWSAEGEPPLTLLARRYLHDVEVILTEGYKQDVQPKIEVFRKELLSEPLCKDDGTLFALVGDVYPGLSVPQFSMEQVESLADLVEQRFLRDRSPAETELFIDGVAISLTPFVQRFVAETIRGMISALRGVDSEKEIEIRVSTVSKQEE